MPQDDAIKAIMGLIEDQRVLELDQAAVRIPSHSYQEHALADFYANRLADLGLEVEIMDVRREEPAARRPWHAARTLGGGASGSARREGPMFNVSMVYTVLCLVW